MSEIKRVALCTVETEKVRDEVPKKYPKTTRIAVALPESNEDTCPEFNYKDELAAAKKRSKSNKETTTENGLDPFGEDDSDVRRIALEMEAKYGSGLSGPKKRRKGKKDDYADIGMGYDENDSFIDNTDGYDEIIPENVTTLHGGFYINCGALEFKTDEKASSHVSSSSSDSSSSDSESNEDATKVKKKRPLDTTDESGSDTAKKDAHAKKQKINAKNSIQHAIQKKLFSQEKIKVKKRGGDRSDKIKKLIKEKREDLNMSVPSDLLQTTEDNLEKDSLKENKKPMSITSVTDAIESVVKQVVEESYDNNQNKQNINVNNGMETEPSMISIDVITENDSSQSATSSEKIELVMLPENIPSDILDIINKLKQAAIEFKGDVRKRFFTDEVNYNLQNLEKKCRILGKSSRLRVYDHLAYYLKLKRESLIKRAKLLLLKQEENSVNQMKRKLKEIIDSTMPRLIASYDQENQKVLQMRFSKDGIGEDNSNLKAPKRRFHWNLEAKQILKDIITSKKKCLTLEGKQKTKMEEYVVNFMIKELIPLWPEGWMSINPLKKTFNSMTENHLSGNNSTLNDSSSVILDINNVSQQKHSNLTITPVIPKSSSTKAEISNSVTVTKLAVSDVPPNSKKIAETITSNSLEMTMALSSPHLMKIMIDDLGKTDKKLSPTQPVSSNYKEDKVSSEKNHSPKKVAEVPKPKQNEIFKPYSDKPSSKAELSKPWPKELFITPAEQAAPKDYSKYRHNDGKVEYLKARKEEKHAAIETVNKIVKSDNSNPNCTMSEVVKHSWHQDVLQPPKPKQSDMEVPKHIRHNDMSSLKHPKSHTKHNDVPKSTATSDFKHISDLLKLPSEPSKHKPKDGLKLASDSVIVYQKDMLKESDLTSVIPKSTHCQVYDYSDARSKLKKDEGRAFKYSKDIPCPEIYTESSLPSTSSFYPVKPNYQDYASNTNFMSSAHMTKSEGDDIQKVMENLRALQKLSCSPVKSDISTSSPVSVIAYNNSFSSPKANQNMSKNDFTAFQDDFQKQFINSLQQMAASNPTSKPNYKGS